MGIARRSRRRHGVGLIKPYRAIELLCGPRLEVMRRELAFGAVDDPDGAFEHGPRKVGPKRSAMAPSAKTRMGSALGAALKSVAERSQALRLKGNNAVSVIKPS